MKLLQLDRSIRVVVFETGLADDAGLLLELLISLSFIFTFLFESRKFRLNVGEVPCQALQLMLFLLVLLFNVLELLACVGQNDDSSCNLFAKFVKLFISFFNFLVESLVLDFQLFKVDQMKAIS